MTKAQFHKKVEHLIDVTSNEIQNRADKLLESGAIDLDAWADDYRLPKAFMCAACRVMTAQWQPNTATDRSKADHIEHFI